jgi:2-polyprenyl-3-methyl-5-hydroxy-6-metoxy-1,4-benzoquinol methylase
MVSGIEKGIEAVAKFFDLSRWRFRWRYWRGRTPWDTNITPPEVMEFINTAPPGKALDLGCGTGTNAITLARHGWQVTGVDFVSSAIRAARAKAVACGLNIDFYQTSVTDSRFLIGPYDYALDIGCLFTLKAEDRPKYAENLVRLLRPQACYMLYAWLPRPWKKKMVGIAAEEVKRLFSPYFAEYRTAIGAEKGYPSAWYWFQRH